MDFGPASNHYSEGEDLCADFYLITTVLVIASTTCHAAVAMSNDIPNKEAVAMWEQCLFYKKLNCLDVPF